MGRIHILPEHVANKIAAGEAVERPASVVKELLENSLDAGASRITVHVEAGGKKLIRITDNGCGMVRDDALLAFERHATSKIKNAEDLLTISTLGFRGEALPSIASVSRLRLETASADQDAGTVVDIAGGKILRVEDAGLPAGTSISVRDLFFNTPARKKFLKADSTELSHIASLVTHYALAHPNKHFELHSLTNALLIAPPVVGHRERVYQIFGKDVLDQLVPVEADLPLERTGLPQRPPWKREEEDTDQLLPGVLRLHGFASKPEIQKLNRNSIYTFVNARLVRDRSIQHALSDAYRNILPPTVFPVVLLFLDIPTTEVDVNVHPSKTEIRFRQQTVVHDCIRDAVRAALVAARPVPSFITEIRAHPTAAPALSPKSQAAAAAAMSPAAESFALEPPGQPIVSERFDFSGGIGVDGQAVSAPVATTAALEQRLSAGWQSHESACVLPEMDEGGAQEALGFAAMKPLGQLHDSFILAVTGDALWIIDQHVAHERVLFERVLRQQARHQVESQRLLMPIVIELSAAQQAVFLEISQELQKNGFEVEAFGARSIVVKLAPAGVPAGEVERIIDELLEQFSREEQALNLEQVRRRIAASIACHAAIKVNMPLEVNKMEWLLRELAQTECPISCPHGRPVVLRYSIKDIQKAFKRI
ncbi:MAG: DNA mismatch repair endonuclease MutL [Acidobacteria bacterium]|nr:DNA mismatch repair endonuclease MutL [Acidobacteriota bacterium]